MTEHVLWVSTSTTTRGGVAAYVRTMRDTPLWNRWSIEHVATHQDGSAVRRVVRFGVGGGAVAVRLLRRRPRLLHLHTASRGSFVRKSALARLADLRGVPVVLHVHGGGFADFHDGLPSAGRRWVRRTLERADVVIALGATWATQLRRIAPGAHVEVMPNAVRPVPWRPPPDPAELVTVLFLGDLVVDKGVPILVEAWARALTVIPPPLAARCRLVLAGAGDRGAVADLLERRGVRDSVDLPGWVAGDRVAVLLDDAAVLVLPSRAEGQPMAVLEAMAHGRAVVATDVGGVPDLVDDTCGLLVPRDDPAALSEALVAVLSDPVLRARLGAGGRSRVVQHFDAAVVADRLDALYRELLR